MKCIKCGRDLYKNSKGSAHARCTPNKCIQCGKEKKTSVGDRCTSCHISHMSKGKVLSEETKDKIRTARLGKKASKKTKLKMSASHAGKKNHMYGKPPSKKAGRGIRTHYKEICFRSTYEAKVAKWLDENSFEWYYEKYRICFDEYTYLPDFFIYENNSLTTIIEVKGYMSVETKKMLNEIEKNIHTNFEIWDKGVLEDKGIL